MVDRDSQIVKRYSVEGLEQQFGGNKLESTGNYSNVLIRHGGGIVKDEIVPKRLRENKPCQLFIWMRR